ncbi:MAG: biopolymer transporter ExbD [Verrucomicrobia bacterium]|jgi:biopolymer transport protein ExbD|nr:biopolymer transporter ExbD [Verrucomicrobiota bacterium]
MRRKRSADGCDLDMTPMIDVVFQMIIFFIVTLKMDENINENIELEDAPESPVYKGEDKRTIIIEVDRRGWLSINNYQLTETKLRQIVRARYNKFGTFPVMIRADKKTEHKDVRKVMDICTDVGLWRIDFAAIKEAK